MSSMRLGTLEFARHSERRQRFRSSGRPTTWSLARPEGNTTGTSFLSADLDGKRQEILIESVPGLRRIAALADPSSPADEVIE